MEIPELSKRLALKVEDICQLLLPNGTRVGNEWVVGDAKGNLSSKGKGFGSCKVCLSGEKVGRWADFSTNESGDLHDLWMVNRGLSKKETSREVMKFLRVEEVDLKGSIKNFKIPVLKNYYMPKKVLEYLKGRGLTEETIKDFKIAETVHFFKEENKRLDSIIFPYFEDDKLTFVKYLALERNEKKIIEVEGGCKPILFGWQSLKNERVVILTEGEIDAMTWHQYGYPALSVPFGGGGRGKQDWIQYEFDNLELFDRVYLSFDSDPSGEVALSELVQRLGRHRCKIIKLPFKDANDCLKNGLDKAEMDRAFENAQYLDPIELKKPSDFSDGVIRSFYPSENDARGYAPLWKNGESGIYFHPSNLVIWTGINGHGKTAVLNQGALLDAIEQRHKVCLFSFEMHPDEQLNWMISQATGQRRPTAEYIKKTLNYYDGKLWVFDWVMFSSQFRLRRHKTSTVLELCEYGLKRFGIDVFIIDSLMRLDIKEDDYNGQKDFINDLMTFVAQYKAIVHLVVHPRKVSNEYETIDKLDVGGTGKITDLAHEVIVVKRNAKKEDKLAQYAIQPDLLSQAEYDKYNAEPDTMVFTRKGRNRMNKRSAIGLWYDENSMQFSEVSGSSPRVYVSQYEEEF